jgi:hypothetical protein
MANRKQTSQWPNEKGQRDEQRSTKYTGKLNNLKVFGSNKTYSQHRDSSCRDCFEQRDNSYFCNNIALGSFDSVASLLAATVYK